MPKVERAEKQKYYGRKTDKECSPSVYQYKMEKKKERASEKEIECSKLP
jgi:hypothetical protein